MSESDGPDGGADERAAGDPVAARDPAVEPEAAGAAESPRSAFVRALSVPRNARIGGVAGVALALVLYAVFVVLPGDTTRDPLLMVVLSFVVAVSTALLVATLLTVREAARMTMSPPKWIRRGGRTALGAGIGWATLAALSVPGAAGVSIPDPAVTAAALVLPLPPLGLAYGAWAVHAAARQREAYPARAGAVGLVAAVVGFLLVSWLAAVDPAAFLGLNPVVTPETFFGISLLPVVGTSLLGAAALRSGAWSPDGPVALLFSLPAVLGLLTAVAASDAGSLSALSIGLPTGVAWAVAARHLAAGRGVPSEAAFRESLEGRMPADVRGSGERPDS